MSNAVFHPSGYPLTRSRNLSFGPRASHTLATKLVLGLLAAVFTACDDASVTPPPPEIPDIVVIRREAGGPRDAGSKDAAADAAVLGDAATDAQSHASGTSTASSARSHSAVAPDAAPVTLALCGNGILESGEQCDDGNQSVTDGCVSCLIVPVCGNGVVESGELCDDANAIATDGCAGCVVVPLCGNGTVELGEDCDSTDPAVCRECRHVKRPTCGNGRVELGEQCDSAAEACVNCRLVTPLCGDGTINSDEQCDDANTFDNDGCDRLCRVRKCGDGVVQDGEHCDPPGATCRTDCTLLPPHCGDGLTQVAEREVCDDGNTTRGDGCYNCDVECGNGLVEPLLGELCEPEMVTRPCTASITGYCVPCAGADCELRDMCDTSCRPVPSCVSPIASSNEDASADDPDAGLVCETPETPVGPCHLPPVNLEPAGSFDTDVGGFGPGDPRVTLSHASGDGFAAPGALLIVFDNAATGGSTEARGAIQCLAVEANKLYDFQAAYRFLDVTWQASGVTVSLFLYDSAGCTGSPVTPEQSRGVKAGVTTAWTGYSMSVDTSSLDPTGPTSMLVKLDVWRSPEQQTAAVLWDDVSIVERGAIAPCAEWSNGDAGTAQTTPPD